MGEPERLNKAAPALLATIHEYQNPKAALVALRDRIYVVLMQWGLMYMAQIPCEKLGVHPINRWDTGIDPSEVVNKDSKFCVAGFSLNETLSAICVERI